MSYRSADLGSDSSVLTRGRLPAEDRPSRSLHRAKRKTVNDRRAGPPAMPGTLHAQHGRLTPARSFVHSSHEKEHGRQESVLRRPVGSLRCLPRGCVRNDPADRCGGERMKSSFSCCAGWEDPEKLPGCHRQETGTKNASGGQLGLPREAM